MLLARVMLTGTKIARFCSAYWLPACSVVCCAWVPEDERRAALVSFGLFVGGVKWYIFGIEKRMLSRW
jgi:hypothetical protein